MNITEEKDEQMDQGASFLKLPDLTFELLKTSICLNVPEKYIYDTRANVLN